MSAQRAKPTRMLFVAELSEHSEASHLDKQELDADEPGGDADSTLTMWLEAAFDTALAQVLPIGQHRAAYESRESLGSVRWRSVGIVR
jgi:hypothetical protein